MIANGRWKRRLAALFILLVLAAVPLSLLVWYKLFRDVPQPSWVTSRQDMNFLYGSIGAEEQAGLPYWIVVVLPRIFGPEYLPGPGGYASLGLPWDEGKELPAGFSKKTIGFDRVGFNCALCHSTRYRVRETDPPTIVAGGGSHTADIQGLMNFFGDAANDPRFNADTILTEIDLATKLGPVDRLLYRFAFIPIAKRRLAEQARQFAWARSRPDWGPGRDAPMNLTKFNLLRMAHDDGSVDNTAFPALWHLDARVQPGRTWSESDFSVVSDFSHAPLPQARLMLMNLAGDTTSFRSVIIDSALGLQAKDSAFFRKRVADLESWLRKVPAPPYPVPPSPEETSDAAHGREVFEASCAACHAPGRENRLGTVIPLAEIGTDPERTNAWTLEAANGANKVVAGLGIHRTPMTKPSSPGYTAVQLDGIWLRAPYLHNGSVPTLHDLLEPPACRPSTFYGGWDVLDGENVGFVDRRCDEPTVSRPAGCEAVASPGCMPRDKGRLFDTTLRGNGNGGHDFGTRLPAADKKALIAYLKTL